MPPPGATSHAAPAPPVYDRIVVDKRVHGKGGSATGHTNQASPDDAYMLRLGGRTGGRGAGAATRVFPRVAHWSDSGGTVRMDRYEY